MLPDFARRRFATGAAFCFTLVAAVLGCGEALETPFFADSEPSQGGASGASQGGTAGSAVGGSALGGDAGSGATTGGATGGDAGAAGMAGAAGFGAVGGTGSGGAAGAGSGGMSGTDAGGSGGSGGVSVDCSAADTAAVSFDGHCYVFRATLRTWMAARDDCSAHGAHLATISSEGRTETAFAAENEFVWTLGGMTEVWMGATDGRQSNQSGNGTPYTWITGEPMTYDHWSAGQPNNSQASCMDGAPCSCNDMCWEHCGFLWAPNADEAGTWNDRHCEHLIGYVCEWDEPPM